MTSVFSQLQDEVLPSASALRAAITAATLRDEQICLTELLRDFSITSEQKQRAAARAGALVKKVREKRRSGTGVDALMHEFSLNSTEGIALMCLAESLLRIPDAATADALIRDKLVKGDWRAHIGNSPSAFVNAAAWALLMTGKLLAPADDGLGGALKSALARGGEPLIRAAMDHAMRLLARQFVAGERIDEALERSKEAESRGYRHSYDMLGEAALTERDAARYFAAYEEAIHRIGEHSAAAKGIGDPTRAPGISIKLSALHPRYCRAQRQRVMDELLPRLRQLALVASRYDIGLNIDAEESDRLELSLDLFEALALDQALRGYQGLGFVVQAYQRRAVFVIDWLADLAVRSNHRLMIRLVKGAYWDSEIKRAQMDGLATYPVFTRKPHTDLSYLACASKLLAHGDKFFAQFATHNAYTAATIIEMAGTSKSAAWEFQCLHGMGEALYDEIVGTAPFDFPCRIYAPVGVHESLLAYLVRRLLENGANTSFVNRIVDEGVSIAELLRDPIDFAARHGGAPHPSIAQPPQLYGALRRNSAGLDLNNENALRQLALKLKAFDQQTWIAHPSVGGGLPAAEVRSPAERSDLVGQVHEASEDDIERALQQARSFAAAWSNIPPQQRAQILDNAADMLENAREEFFALAVREAGKTFPNAVAEVREAVDFMRYYAMQARHTLHGAPRGVIVCISPWNFPLSIFCGQVVAALVAGNAVIAKPAEQTPLIASRIVQLLYDAGIPRAALAFVPGGEKVGRKLVADPRIDGVVFTGSVAVGQSIAEQLRALGGERMLIAETGGLNAMIVDASALPEQVVQDALVSAFDSAGQRCSALRVLCLQSDIADRVLVPLKAAMQELRVGQPGLLSTDIGPIIDGDARHQLLTHLACMGARGFRITQHRLSEAGEDGVYFAPAIVEVNTIDDIPGEVFGPILHVLRWSREDLPALVEQINARGFGLTMGVQSRIDATVDLIRERARIGNLYVNRSMIGAVVGVQPFGGEGLSGTGPKAGGPLYLQRMLKEGSTQAVCLEGEALSADLWRLPGPTGEENLLSFLPRADVSFGSLHAFPTERTLTRNLAASGGNTDLMTLGE